MLKKVKEDLYNLDKVQNAIKEEKNVYIVTKKQYADILINEGFTATIVSNELCKKAEIRKEYSRCFLGAYVVILVDNSERDFIKNELQNYAHATKVIDIRDIESYLDNCNMKENFMELIRSKQWKYASWIKICKDNSLKINPGILSKFIAKDLNVVLIGSIQSENDLIYIYKEGVYENVSKLTIKKYIKSYIPSQFQSNNLINNIAELIIINEVQCADILRGKEEIINLKNGLYNTKTKKFTEHTEKYISETQINIAYSIEAENHGYWDNFIKTLVNGDIELINVLQEWTGLILSNFRGCLAKKSLILLGKGDTGKSQFLNMLIHLVSQKNTAQVSMQKLGHRFALARIVNVRIIHNADLPRKLVDDESLAVFKQLTGGDAIFIEPKGKDGFDIFFNGVLMYCANKLPAITGDFGNHIFDRFIIIPCSNVIPVEKRDPNLLNKLKMDDSYIFNWAMQGLERLLSNNFKFTEAQNCKNEKAKFAIECDSVRGFISEHYDVTKNRKDRIKSSSLYHKYLNWCTQNGYHACSSREFKNRLEQNLCIKYNKKYDGNPCYEYIKKKEFTEIENEDVLF